MNLSRNPGALFRAGGMTRTSDKNPFLKSPRHPNSHCRQPSEHVPHRVAAAVMKERSSSRRPIVVPGSEHTRNDLKAPTRQRGNRHNRNHGQRHCASGDRVPCKGNLRDVPTLLPETAVTHRGPVCRATACSSLRREPRLRPEMTVSDAARSGTRAITQQCGKTRSNRVDRHAINVSIRKPTQTAHSVPRGINTCGKGWLNVLRGYGRKFPSKMSTGTGQRPALCTAKGHGKCLWRSQVMYSTCKKPDAATSIACNP